MIPRMVPGRDGLDWERIVIGSDGLSGADIKTASIISVSAAADRSDQHRRISTDDVVAAIESVRKSKMNVGPALSARSLDPSNIGFYGKERAL
jgi:ATP-dependent 26S proteasome regulatory subunit